MNKAVLKQCYHDDNTGTFHPILRRISPSQYDQGKALTKNVAKNLLLYKIGGLNLFTGQLIWKKLYNKETDHINIS